MKEKLGTATAEGMISGFRNLVSKLVGRKRLKQAEKEPEILEAVIKEVAEKSSTDESIRKQLESYFTEIRRIESLINNESGVAQNVKNYGTMGDVVAGDKFSGDKVGGDKFSGYNFRRI